MVILILLVAFVLRLVVLDQSLWLDEAINVNVARSLDFKSLIFNYTLSDFHPPLYHLILKSWILFFGSSEIFVRLPSVILGTATVGLVYLIGKKLFETKTALIASTLMATGPLAIYYSQEARMYMLATFLTAVSVYFFISILKKESVVTWFGFIVSTSVLLYSDYLPYLVIPSYILYLIFFRKKISKFTLKAFIPSLILIFFLTLPWLLVFPKQFQAGLSTAAASPTWAQVVGSPDPKNLLLVPVKFTIGRISHENDLTFALIFLPVAVFVSFLLVFSLMRLSPLRSFLWFWLVVPIFLAFIISFYVPIFAYFRLIFVLPAFYLLMASAINTINWTPLVRLLLTFALAINLVSTIIYYTNPRFKREDWRAATEFVHGLQTPKSLVLFLAPYSLAPFDHYNQGKLKTAGALGLEDINVQTANADRVFLFQYLSGINDPQGEVFEKLSKLGFVNSKTQDFPGVGFVYVFEK